MTRVYETLIVVDAENEKDAFKKLNELGDMIYTIELEQCCVTEEKIELETEGSVFDRDDVQFITHSLFRIAESLEILTKHFVDNK